MNIQSEAKQVAGSIIEWCCTKEHEVEDENYPSHIVENLLQRQKGELIGEACDLMITALNEGIISTGDIGKLNMWLRKAMEE